MSLPFDKTTCFLFYSMPTKRKTGTMLLVYPFLDGRTRMEYWPFNPSLRQASHEAALWLQRNVSLYRHVVGIQVTPVKVTRDDLADIMRAVEAQQ